MGHSGEGKTTLVEAMLFNGGAIERMGKIENGTTVSDFDEQEIARKSSVSLSVAYLIWKEHKLNLLDVPGFYDFEGELSSAMRAAGAALVVTDANGTVYYDNDPENAVDNLATHGYRIIWTSPFSSVDTPVFPLNNPFAEAVIKLIQQCLTI